MDLRPEKGYLPFPWPLPRPLLPLGPLSGGGTFLLGGVAGGFPRLGLGGATNGGGRTISPGSGTGFTGEGETFVGAGCGFFRAGGRAGTNGGLVAVGAGFVEVGEGGAECVEVFCETEEESAGADTGMKAFAAGAVSGVGEGVGSTVGGIREGASVGGSVGTEVEVGCRVKVALGVGLLAPSAMDRAAGVALVRLPFRPDFPRRRACPPKTFATRMKAATPVTRMGIPSGIRNRLGMPCCAGSRAIPSGMGMGDSA